MNLLITGGAGFIGSCYARLVRRTRSQDLLVNVDALTYAGNLENLRHLEGDPRHVFVKADIRDGATMLDLMRRHQIEAVVNFAAESHVDRSIQSAEPFLDTNVMGTLKLLEAARTAGVKRYVQVSTDEVYGSLGPTGAFEETTAHHAAQPYSASKAAADHFVMAFHHTHGMDTVITRCSVYFISDYQFPEKLIRSPAILNAFAGQTLPIYGDSMQNTRLDPRRGDHCGRPSTSCSGRRRGRGLQRRRRERAAQPRCRCARSSRCAGRARRSCATSPTARGTIAATP